MKNLKATASNLFPIHQHPSQAQQLLEIALLVRRAAEGDPHAVDTVVRRYRAMLLRVARRSLGKHFGDEAEDVVQDFCIALVERRLRFVPVRGDAVAWMRDVVRKMAKANRAERERDWGLDDADEEVPR